MGTIIGLTRTVFKLLFQQKQNVALHKLLSLKSVLGSQISQRLGEPAGVMTLLSRMLRRVRF